MSRPRVIVDSLEAAEKEHRYVVHADLRQFYDRVRPALLVQEIERVRRVGDDPAFFLLAKSLLNWAWDSRDERDIRIYAKQAGLEDFKRVALPQGLVASGFFANVVLLPFDRALQAAIGTEIIPNVLLEDVCRYVDDLRLVIALDSTADRHRVGTKLIENWLAKVLDEQAPGLVLSSEKTQVAKFGGDDQPLIAQSSKMSRIQSAVSGGFDAYGGEEILDAIQGLIRAQESVSVDDGSGWRFSPVPDVRDETVVRFSAARYRTTFRSIRPLLDHYSTREPVPESSEAKPVSARLGSVRTQRDLDDDARAFALGLIERWIGDPSNVRLLRIGLDLWPDVEVLREVLSLLRPFTQAGGRRKEPRRVAWYCLAEILRAGATETGLVADVESLPTRVNLESYRKELKKEAARLVALPGRSIPWYLRQQALLFLAAFDPAYAPVTRFGTVPETRHYRKLIRFLRGEGDKLRSGDFATLAILARRAFADRKQAIELIRHGLTPKRIWQLTQRDPSFLLEIMDAEKDLVPIDDLPTRAREDLGQSLDASEGHSETLARVVLSARSNGRLRNELSLLRFACAFLEQWGKEQRPPSVITPGQVTLKISEDRTVAAVDELMILGSRTGSTGSMYEVPVWCEVKMKWRFQLGFLLRFILAQHPDFTRPIREENWRESKSAYRPAESHWYQRLYGHFSGQPAFGDDWAPITGWMESFLLALLRWPGCRAPEGFGWIEQGIETARNHIEERVAEIDGQRGAATGALILPINVKRPTAANEPRPLRACVVQTVVPTADQLADQFKSNDFALNDPAIRKEHRNHLSAALAAVERMLFLRDTHKKCERRLDWLILPELAVHPQDVLTHLVPFARAHRTIVLAGLTYQKLVLGFPHINSALWVIPEWSNSYGMQIRTRRQGKKYLAPEEQGINNRYGEVLGGFRPCQWLIGYPWSNKGDARPVWLSSAVCYDATDLSLAADLKDKTDIFAIPALNKDVQTFDQMALALHYHMFQLVIVANNGQFGGSNAYWPKKAQYHRQVFHTHGQPQASISFLEIDDIGDFLNRKHAKKKRKKIKTGWKQPPAGLQ